MNSIKIYLTTTGIQLQNQQGLVCSVPGNWDDFINQKNLFEVCSMHLLNGVQANKLGLSLRKTVSLNGYYHNFIESVDPYIVKGNSQSGLLPFINKDKPGIDGMADHKIQAYCYRMTLTNHPENRTPFLKPEGYNDMDYELLFRNYEAADGLVSKMYSYGDPLVPWINADMPNRKTDTNN